MTTTATSPWRLGGRRRTGDRAERRAGAACATVSVVPEPDAPLADLVLRVGAGDQQAYADLYDEVAASVLGLAVRVLRDRAQAEEVAQEALLEVWRQAPRYDPAQGSVRGWILMITHRRAVDRVRSAQASAERDLAAGTTGSLAPGVAYDEVADLVADRLASQQVRAALHDLSSVQRESIVLAYYGGHSQSEIAAMLDLPLGTVKTRMRDGMIRLRRLLGSEREEVTR